MRDVNRLARPAIRDLAIFSACINLLMLTMPVYLLQVYDRVLASSSINTLIFISMAAGLAILVMSLLEAVRYIYSAKIASRLDDALAEPVLMVMLTKGDGNGDVSRLRDLATVRSFVEQRTALVLFDVPFALLFIIILFFVHPYIAGLTLGGALVLSVLAFLQYWLTKAGAMEAAAASAFDLQDAAILSREAPTIRALGMVGALSRRWAERHAGGLIENINVSSVSAKLTGFSKFIRTLLQIAILGSGAYLVLTNQMTAGMIFASSIVSGRALQPIDQLVGSWRSIFDARGAWQRVISVAALADGNTDPIARETPSGHITAEDLGFVVPGRDKQPKIVLNIRALQFQPGETVALVGPSGSGKSTLLRILAGAQDGFRGTVRIDGTSLVNWDRSFLGANVGYLPQDVELLPGTIAQNIARFVADASDDEIIEAARQAKVDKVIEELPMGYDTLIKSQAHVLSGGQRQLICLARAFFRSPPILIMDEPNSNLDAVGRAAYKQIVADARAASKTVIFATHDSDLFMSADKMCVLENGAVTAFGSPADVVAKRREAQNQAAQHANSAPAGHANGHRKKGRRVERSKRPGVANAANKSIERARSLKTPDPQPAT
ncbi:MAG: type I secretion system permease/ATPase [Pseudomonadota bacterium]